MFKERERVIRRYLNKGKRILFFSSIFLVFLNVFYFSGLSAQQEITYVIAEVIDKTDGLSSNQITCLYRDEKRWLFVGTKNGLNIYDGHSVNWNGTNIKKDYPLNGNHITSFFVDETGSIFIGSNNGIDKINVFEKTKASFFNKNNKLFPPSSKGKEQYDWVAKTVNGQVWMVSKGVLHQMKGENLVPVWADKYFQIRELSTSHQLIRYFMSAFFRYIPFKNKSVAELCTYF